MSSSKRTTLKDVLKTSLPAIVDLSSQPIAWLIEAIYIGQISAAAIAGVGLTLQIVLLTFTVVLTFVMGASIIIIRYLGENDRRSANHVLAQALIIGTGLSFLISLAWYFGGTQLLHMIKEDAPSARIYGVQYLQVVSYFGPLIIVNFMALGIMRMAGDTLLTMRINLVTNLLHVTLAPVLIFGLGGFPRMEARGAAIAVCIAHSLAFCYTLYTLRSRKSMLFLSFREYTSPNWETFKRLFKLGIPTTIEQLVWAIGQLVLSFYAAQIGILVLATHQVLMRIQIVLNMAYQGVGMASMTLVGKNIGAKNQRRIKDTGRVAGAVAFITSLLAAGVLIVFQQFWLGIFTADQAVIALGSQLILLVALIQVPKAINAVATSNLRGSADLQWLMWIAISSVIIFETITAYFFSFVLYMSLAGLWLIQGIDEAVRLFLNNWRFRQQKWKINQIL